MKAKQIRYLIVSVIAVLLLCSCGETSPKTSLIPNSNVDNEYVELNDKAYKELRSLLASRYNSGDIRNYYSEVQSVAPNSNLFAFNGYEEYFLSIYRYGKGKIAVIFDEKNEHPDRFIECIYYAKPTKKEQLLDATEIADILSLFECTEDEFLYYINSLEFSSMFEKNSERTTHGAYALFLTDDGFYSIEFEPDLYIETKDGAAINHSCKIAAAKKCESVFFNNLYELIKKK